MIEPSSPGPIRVLHVDDEPDLAELTATFLERENEAFHVETATSVAEGEELLDARTFDCVVSDYDMPRRNGIEFLESVRADHPELPFVLFTGKGSEEVASDAISAGVTDYLQKEGGTDQYTILANRITNAVEHYRSRRKVEASERRLREIIDALPHFLYVVDEDGTYLLANEALADFHDATVGEIEGANVDDVLEDAHAEQFRANLRDVLDAEESVRFPEIEMAGPDGDTHVFEPRLRPYEFGDTDHRAVLGIATEVTDRRRREAELERTARRYRAIFNDPNILVGLLDTDGTVLDINDTAIEYIDGAREDVVGAPFWETPWFDHSEAVRADVREWVDQAASGEYVEFELDLVGPDGDPYTVEGVFRPVTDEDGDVVSLIVSDRETTEQRRRERDLEQTNALLSTLFDTLPVGVLAEDGSRTVLAANQQMFDRFEMPGSPADVVGEDCQRLAREFSDTFVDPGAFVDRVDEIVAARQPVRDEELELRDGRTVTRSYRPVELAGDDGHLWVYRDVTEQTEHETRLEALSETTRELMGADTREGVAEIAVNAAADVLGLEASSVHLYDEDAGGLVPVYQTDAGNDLVGDPPTFAPGGSIAWRVYERGETVALDDVHDDPDVYNPDSPVRSELVVPVGDAGILIASSTTPEAFDQQDRMLGEILAGNVATALEQVERTAELRARERELTRQNDRLEEFASVVSHDLRNPLNVAQGRLEMARGTRENDRETLEIDYLDDVARALDRMDGLVDDLLTLARDGDRVREFEAVDLPAVCRTSWEHVETGAATLQVTTGARILADRSRLQQLLENLFRNAVEHGSTGNQNAARSDDAVEHGATNPGSQTRQDAVEDGGDDVTVTVGDLETGFYVADDGPGIPESDRDTVFDVGYTTATDGTGFGLSIVKQVADAHGWDVTIAESDDGGARFEITGVDTAP